MLGVTTHITLDIAAIPLLWVIPLGLYLLSFILVFARWPGWLHTILVIALPLVLLLLIFVNLAEIDMPIALRLGNPLLAFFVVALVCHGELARTRPAARSLTQFYLLMSVGGVLGGMFNALVAPLIFDTVAEYDVAIALACMVLPRMYYSNDFGLAAWFLKKIANLTGTAKRDNPVERLAVSLRSDPPSPVIWIAGLLSTWERPRLLESLLINWYASPCRRISAPAPGSAITMSSFNVGRRVGCAPSLIRCTPNSAT